jgi:hypothetical protein
VSGKIVEVDSGMPVRVMSVGVNAGEFVTASVGGIVEAVKGGAKETVVCGTRVRVACDNVAVFGGVFASGVQQVVVFFVVNVGTANGFLTVEQANRERITKPKLRFFINRWLSRKKAKRDFTCTIQLPGLLRLAHIPLEDLFQLGTYSG